MRRKVPVIKRGYNWLRNALTRDKIVKNQAKKNKHIVYGARAIQAQTGIFSRGTKDWDVFAKNPKEAAMKTEKQFESLNKGDQFYVKPTLHPGTHKVMHKGWDGRKNTKDDMGVVDYTKMPCPKPPVKKVKGIMFRSLAQEAKAKRKSIKDPAFAFRHEKDREDLARIKFAQGRL